MDALAFFDGECYFGIVSEVSESWDRVKMIESYDEMFGATLFKCMYDIAPDAWTPFAFTADDVEQKNEKFMVFAKRFVRMLDLAVHMLGPDMDIVAEEMMDLGPAHARYGVTARHFELMGQALGHTLEKVLSSRDCTPSTKHSWEKIFSFMSAYMLEGAKSV
ncbi:expressed unknown protein [Seminavis robusta]|uniref:Globin domain-containing protein n=1 Tax=Seminavis robusta TaxID=568900 RepID=A0A9N8DUU6_9STRA|nr:expressed unknown protein [Seminavis robusta]|eukprot:Sro298_g111180.1 n/a (162) ;mRNA; r:59090-59575